MLNKKLQTDHMNEMCYQLFKLMTKQLKNPESRRIVGIKSFTRLFGITTALIKVSAAQEERLIQAKQDQFYWDQQKYSELSATEAIQADCDVKATNIILQGLPPEVYVLVSNHRIVKELWKIIQLLMQGTSLTKQERGCKLYDELDKFDYKMGETLHVKLVKDLHTTNIDQLHAYLGQHEFHANEVRLMHERNSDTLALSPQHGSPYQSQQYLNNQSSTPLSITYPSNDYQSSVYHNVYSPPLSIPQLEYAPTINQQPKFPQLDSGLIVPVFQKGDDPIDAINHMMSFLTAVVTSRYPTTNNQLKNSSNPRQQATINDGRVTIQLV
ncbi:hypothetical protein Tco_1287486 [Tanacetum coccineum]